MLNLFLVSICHQTYEKGLKIHHFENPYFQQKFTPYGVFRILRVKKFPKMLFLHNQRLFLTRNYWYQPNYVKNSCGNEFSEIPLTLSVRYLFFKKAIFFDKNFQFVNFAVAFRRSISHQVSLFFNVESISGIHMPPNVRERP